MARNPFERDQRREEISIAKESRESVNFVRRILDEVISPSAYVVLRFLDRTNRIKSYFHKSKTYEFAPFRDGQNIALVAIWEYEVLRKDVKELLKELKRRDFYICLVNTGKIKTLEFSDLASVYIERFNYGRDFGSYKEGIQFLQKTGRLSSANKLVIINDSVYFLQDYIGSTLDEIQADSSDLLGLTENFELNHHVGSFFVAFSSKILNGKPFKRFWKRFKVSDLRTHNIYFGEMMLTKKVGAKIAPEKIRVLWSISSMAAQIKSPESLNQAIMLANRGHISTWKKVSWQLIAKSFLDERYIFISDFQKRTNLSLSNGTNNDHDSINSKLILGYGDLMNAMKDASGREVTPDSEYELFMKAKGIWLNIVGSGSQIHQNNNLFVSHGMPLVKLDLLYRGAFSYEDLEILLDKIKNSEDAQILRSMLYRRIYGLDYLSGWRRAAFRKGMI